MLHQVCNAVEMQSKYLLLHQEGSLEETTEPIVYWNFLAKHPPAPLHISLCWAELGEICAK